jgi:uracil-DNA glycosylase
VKDITRNDSILQQALSCTLCKNSLPFAPNPILIWPDKPKVILISQAPGRLAHESNIAWNDASGERLRTWLGVSRAYFYDSGAFAVLPMSFCFPGYKNGADAPPIKICAPTWHHKFLQNTSPEIIIYIGRYAQQAYLKQYQNLTEAIADYHNLLPKAIALPHPSGRNNRWMSKHPWFTSEVVPMLSARIKDILGG